MKGKVNKQKKTGFLFIAGPCVIESKKSAFTIARRLKDIADAEGVRFVFKASFDKANRTSLASYRGPGLDHGLDILSNIKDKLAVSVLTDVHWPHQVAQVSKVADIIQIPAFLCRQTDLILEAARSKKIINIKKGQFLSPFDMSHIIQKIESVKNRKILLTERGTCFGYNNLVVDFRSFMIMKQFGYPVIFDVTHSLQRPSAQKGVTGGNPEFALPLARAAAACGIDGMFMEVHPSPSKALSDKHTMIALRNVRGILQQVMRIKKAIQ